MKKLIDILTGIDVLEIAGNESESVHAVNFDSRKIENGDLFVAVRGTETDGHRFIPTAVERGAKIVVCEEIPEKGFEGVTFVKVKNSEIALGCLASNFFDHPSQKLKLVGITGTNGKTTTVTLLYNMFRAFGHKAGLLSTVVNYIDDKEYPSDHTTPDAVEINFLLQQMVTAGCEYCFMEVSSHSIVQQRIAGLHFAGGIFSNITHDHLDYHKTFSEYLKAKKKFFDELPDSAFALTNIDDKNGSVMLQNTKAKAKTYSLKNLSDFRCRILEDQFDGMLLRIDGKEVWTHFVGEFNAYNLLAVYAAAVLLGKPSEDVLRILSSLYPVSGRFECIRSADGITVIVDYAHTPDALENVLKTIHHVRKGSEQIITVVGAGGHRDKTKRPEMAAIVTEMSDKVILTSDNPRDEKPEDIIHDMQAGVGDMNKKKVLVIVDRAEAIKTSIMLAAPKDIILLAGKGHETYQEINGVKHHFDDREVVKKIFSERDKN